MIESLEELVQAKRWKLFHYKEKKRKNILDLQFNNQGDVNVYDENHGLRTIDKADVDLDLKSFEDNMMYLI